jgi:hypothetical protein
MTMTERNGETNRIEGGMGWIPRIDVDDVVRLARGEHLGARHDAALEALAASPAGREAFRIARAIEADAQQLARAIGVARGGNVVVLAPRAARRPTPIRWAAAAAIGFIAMGAALFGWQGMGPEAAAPVAVSAPAPDSDLIFRASEDGLASAGARKPASDELFDDAFGS